MCLACDLKKSAIVQERMMDFAAPAFGRISMAAHYQKAGADSRFFADGFLGGADGVGDKFDVTYDLVDLPVPVLDNVADDTSTEHALVVDGERFTSTINTPGDQDFYRIELQGGVTYELAVYGTKSGFSGLALPDAYVEVYDAAGNLVAGTDGGSPNDSLGLDARLTFTAPKSGTYYLNARAFDEDSTNGDDGDLVGDYETFVKVSPYKPFYDVRYETRDNPATERDERGLPTVESSPLHSLDWGTVFDNTSRNPDGQEGPRDTGNAVDLEAGGKNVLYYYFGREGEVFLDDRGDPLGLTATMVAKGFEQWEKDAIDLALERYENVADLIYIETDDRGAADIVFVTYNGTPGIETPSLAGRMSPPDTINEGQTEYNAGDYRWTPEGLAPGGVFFGTLIHELGHGHGMSHPHDNGGRSSIMRGVEEIETFVYTTGDFDLNQGVYTMMSYQDGWQESPYGQPANDLGYGFIGSLMAFDIAVIQDKYGVNEAFARGNNVYVLPDENSAAEFDENGKMTKEGTSWKSLWDAAGIDRIVYRGDKDANIDLRPATLEYEEGGGGWVSYAFGVYGGFTVPNGVTIENAAGGSGDDTLIGNFAANALTGNSGKDTLLGLDGRDTLRGGEGADRLQGDDGNDALYGGANADSLFGGEGNDRMNGGDKNDHLNGGGGNDVLDGGLGADRIKGSGGADILSGGNGADVFLYDDASVDGSRDIINRFSRGQGDSVDLSQIDANLNLAGNQGFTFVGAKAFSGAAGELRLFTNADGRQIAAGDVDGDGAADFSIQFNNPAALMVASDFVF